MTQIQLNGKATGLPSDPEMPLLWALREDLNLRGTKYGCGIAACGACTVLLDGKPARSCQIRVGTLDGHSIVTIEGLKDRVARAVQAAWTELDVPQCGYCQSGQVVAAVALLRAKPNPTDRDIDLAMSGNLCRCATYQRIRAAVHKAALTMKA